MEISTDSSLPGRDFSTWIRGLSGWDGAFGEAGGAGGLTTTLRGSVSTSSEMVQVKGGMSFRIAVTISSSSDSRKNRFQEIDTSQVA